MGDAHVLQLGFDDSFWDPASTSDTRQRQSSYAAALERLRPGSRFTSLSVGTSWHPQTSTQGGLVLTTAGKSGSSWKWGLWSRLNEIHRERPIDIIATQSPFMEALVTMPWTRLQGIRMIVQNHGGPLASDAFKGGFRGWKAGLIYAMGVGALRWHGGYRAVTHHEARWVSAATRGRLPVRVIPMAISDFPRVSDVRTNIPPTVLFVGRLVWEKRLRLWLETAAQMARVMPGIRFRIVGSGPEEKALRAEAARLGLAGLVDFAGAVPWGRLRAEYESAAVFLMTSSTEGMPRVLVEAGRCALPVVSTDWPGAEDIVVDGQGGFMRPPMAAALAEACLSLLRDSNLRGSLAAGMRDHVARHFNAEDLAQRWMQFCLDVAESRA